MILAENRSDRMPLIGSISMYPGVALPRLIFISDNRAAKLYAAARLIIGLALIGLQVLNKARALMKHSVIGARGADNKGKAVWCDSRNVDKAVSQDIANGDGDDNYDEFLQQ